MSSNYLDIKERLNIGKVNEDAVFDLLKSRGDIVFNGQRVHRWERAPEDVDIYRKVDAYAFYTDIDGSELRATVAIKYRETGSDLGVAAVRPYDKKSFVTDIREGKPKWDRDMKNRVDLYVALSGNTLMIMHGDRVHNAVKRLLVKLCRDIENSNYVGKTYWHKDCPGAELKIVRDRGGGYSAGQEKLICYISPKLVSLSGGQVFSV